MGYIDTLRHIDWTQVFLVIIVFIPYVDTEIIGVIPGLRDALPVETIHLTRKSWTERGRWLILVIVPVIDGELIRLLTDYDVNDVIADS